jgi:hypothetical protein
MMSPADRSNATVMAQDLTSAHASASGVASTSNSHSYHDTPAAIRDLPNMDWKVDLVRLAKTAELRYVPYTSFKLKKLTVLQKKCTQSSVTYGTNSSGTREYAAAQTCYGGPEGAKEQVNNKSCTFKTGLMCDAGLIVNA